MDPKALIYIIWFILEIVDQKCVTLTLKYFWKKIPLRNVLSFWLIVDRVIPYFRQATDNMELMNLNADGNYGAMWKSRPPNYATDNHHISSPAPPQTDVTSSEHQPRTVLEQTETLTPLHRPNCDVFNTKISTLVSFRPGQPPVRNAHVYESPTFIPRSDIPDIQEIAMHAH